MLTNPTLVQARNAEARRPTARNANPATSTPDRIATSPGCAARAMNSTAAADSGAHTTSRRRSTKRARPGQLGQRQGAGRVLDQHRQAGQDEQAAQAASTDEHADQHRGHAKCPDRHLPRDSARSQRPTVGPSVSSWAQRDEVARRHRGHPEGDADRRHVGADRHDPAETTAAQHGGRRGQRRIAGRQVRNRPNAGQLDGRVKQRRKRERPERRQRNGPSAVARVSARHRDDFKSLQREHGQQDGAPPTVIARGGRRRRGRRQCASRATQTQRPAAATERAWRR